MTSASLFLGLVAVALLLVILGFLWRLVRMPLPLHMQQALEAKEEKKLEILKQEWSQRLMEIGQQLRGQVQTTEISVSQKLQETQNAVAHLTHEIGRLDEATRKMEEVGRNVASLQDLLRAPKMRGGLGEFFLSDLLAQIMPGDFYVLQYEFSDGERVDAAIRLRDKLVPVDSKFPLDHFRKMAQAVTDSERSQWRASLVRDVKQHIDSIASKYIRPSEDTFDFALMYIPAENVYYETVIKDDGVSDQSGVFQHALKRHVIPVSPNSFYAYLQVILQGLRGFAIEERAKEILAHLVRLQKELSGLRENFDTAGKQLNFASSNFQKAERHLARFEDRLEAIEKPDPVSPEALTDSTQGQPKEARRP